MEILEIKGREKLKPFKVVKKDVKITETFRGCTTYYCIIGKDYSIVKYEITVAMDGIVIEFDSFSEFMKSLGNINATREQLSVYVRDEIIKKTNSKNVTVKFTSIPPYPEVESSLTYPAVENRL